MTREEYEAIAKTRLYEYRNKACVDREIAREESWFFSYYEKAKETGDYEHAIDLAVADFIMWV